MFEQAVKQANTNKKEANRFGIIHNTNTDNPLIFLGNKQIISNKDNDIVSKDISIKGDVKNNVWNLLVSKDDTDIDKYTPSEIYEYLSLLKNGGIKLHHNTNKARRIGEYIRNHSKDILDNNVVGSAILLNSDDLNTYSKLQATS